jgi:MFS family permease
VSRFRRAPKGPLSVGAILAMPLFFSALMAVSLALEKPTVELVVKNGQTVEKLGDPSGANELAIYLFALLFPVAVMLVGAAATLIGRAGVVVSAGAAIVASILLLVPLNTWTERHTARYPDGVDLIPKSSNEDIYLQGEWEDRAETTAQQLGIVTIVLGGVAIGVFALLEVRRRRGVVPPVPPPPPEVVSGSGTV